mmetsp:Transcript_22461/g.69152  ORF Transcript_22461/g.69152 Transcript_22461/m.69152 type:complete len:88 (-) Transcript_22461:337-600(-)
MEPGAIIALFQWLLQNSIAGVAGVFVWRADKHARNFNETTERFVDQFSRFTDLFRFLILLSSVCVLMFFVDILFDRCLRRQERLPAS